MLWVLSDWVPFCKQEGIILVPCVNLRVPSANNYRELYYRVAGPSQVIYSIAVFDSHQSNKSGTVAEGAYAPTQSSRVESNQTLKESGEGEGGLHTD